MRTRWKPMLVGKTKSFRKQLGFRALLLCLFFLAGWTPWSGKTPLLSATSTSPSGKWVKYADNTITSLPDCSSIIPKDGWFYGYGWILYYQQNGELKACSHAEAFQTFQALSPNDAWAGGLKGDGSEQLMIFHWNGQDWQESPEPYFQIPDWRKGSGSVLFNRFSFLSPDQGWGVGGTSGMTDYQFLGRRFLFQWDGKNWRTVYPPGLNMDDFPLSTIQMISENDGWVASVTNHVYHWNGKVWTEIFDENGKPFDLNITGLFALSSDNIWLVGHGGSAEAGKMAAAIYYWDGEKWIEQYRDGDVGLESISMLSPTFGWAVGGATYGGYDSFVLFWNGTEWKPFPFPDKIHIQSIKTISEQEAWIFGDDRGEGHYYVYHYSLPADATVTPLPSLSPLPTGRVMVSQETPIVTNAPPSTKTLIVTATTSQVQSGKNTSFDWSIVMLVSGLLIMFVFLLFFLRKRS